METDEPSECRVELASRAAAPSELERLLEALELADDDESGDDGDGDLSQEALAALAPTPGGSSPSTTAPGAKSSTAKSCHGAQCAYDRLIEEYAVRFSVEPALVKAMIRVESGFDPRAVSPKGARGLMQLMPRTALHHGARNLHDPRQNIRAGVRHLRGLLNRYRQNLDLALAAYNAGSRAVKKYGGLPPYQETRSYLARVKHYRQKYREQLPSGDTFSQI